MNTNSSDIKNSLLFTPRPSHSPSVLCFTSRYFRNRTKIPNLSLRGVVGYHVGLILLKRQRMMNSPRTKLFSDPKAASSNLAGDRTFFLLRILHGKRWGCGTVMGSELGSELDRGLVGFGWGEEGRKGAWMFGYLHCTLFPPEHRMPGSRGFPSSRATE